MTGTGQLATAASLNDHLLVVLEHHVVVVVDVEHRHRSKFGRHAAGSWCQTRVHRVDERLDDGVVGGVEIVGQVERTVAGAVERLVAGRRHDPVVPADLAEVHVHRPPSTQVSSPTPAFSTTSPAASFRVAPTTPIVFGLCPNRRRRRRQSSKRCDEVGRPAGSVVAVRHEIRSPPVDDRRHRRSVNLSPDDDKTEILLRSPTPSGYRSTDDKRGPFTGRTLSSGHRDRTLADDPQVPCSDGRVVDPADVTR